MNIKVKRIRWQSLIMDISIIIHNKHISTLKSILHEECNCSSLLIELQLLVLSFFENNYVVHSSPYINSLFKYYALPSNWFDVYINEYICYNYDANKKLGWIPFDTAEDCKKYFLQRYAFYRNLTAEKDKITISSIKQIYFALFHPFIEIPQEVSIYNKVEPDKLRQSWRYITQSLCDFAQEIIDSINATNIIKAENKRHNRALLFHRLKKIHLKYIAVTVMFIVSSVLIYLMLQNNRYDHIDGAYYFDKWTKEKVLVY